MRVVKGILSALISFVILILVLILTLSYSTSYIIKNEILSGELKDKIVDEYIKTEDKEKSEVLKEMLELDESVEIIDEIINEFANYINTGNMKSKDKIVKDIQTFAIKNKALFEKLTGETFDEEKIKSKETYDEIAKSLDDAFKDAGDEIDGDAKDVIKVYSLFISNTVRLIIILSIVTLIMLLMLINWSLTDWMKYFGTSLLISGILFTILYILTNAFMYKLIEMLEITTTINLTILLVVGLCELFVGAILIVLKSLFTKTEKLTN